ncbi:hypothetical protein TA3x_001671 [Tundrisphaera sp. TA3]|uniref:hypothetical protein n=1 Tax=Tundrisphaera sp. TA3 TaxID=3435775 RepID=UPI003EBD656F
MRPTRRFASFLLAPALAFLSVGCGGEAGAPRQAASGTVTLDGKPLESGTITFIPTEGGPGAFGTIQAGTYRFGTGDGPTAGRYAVEIVDVRPTGRTIPNPDAPGTTIAEVRNAIPPRYNARTELVADVKPDAENSFRFDLSTRKPNTRLTRR